MERELWSFVANPNYVLYLTTIMSFSIFFLIVLFSIDSSEGVPLTISDTLASSQWITIGYTVGVFTHGYSIHSYLIIVSEFIDPTSLQFKFICFSCYTYLGALVLVSYLPVDVVHDQHNAAAAMALIFSSFSVLLNKHSFQITLDNPCLIMSEITTFVVMVLAFVLFWLTDLVWFQYIHTAIVLLDKPLKVLVLREYGLIPSGVSYVKYSYHTSSTSKLDI